MTRTLSQALLNGCSQIFLQRSPACGALVLLALLLTSPQLLGHALLGGLASLLVALRRGYPGAETEAGLYGYNGTLLGLLLGAHFAWSPLLPLLALTTAGLSSLLLHHLLKLARRSGGLPAYTLPFVLLGWLLLALDGPLELERSIAPATALQADSAGLAAAVLRGIAQVLFLDDPLAGACLLLGLLLADWRAAAWAAGASLAGLALALFQGWPQDSALLGLYGYNAVLAALALGQSHRWPWAPLTGILLTLLLQPCFPALGTPPLTAPFILACWLVLASSRSARQPVPPPQT